MPNYLLLLHENPAVYQDMSAEEMQAIINKYSAWSESLAQTGKLVAGKKLADGQGRAVSRVNGAISVSDGPYTESKEVIGGFFEIIADDYEAAVAIAQDCPHVENGVVEIREIEIA